MTRKSKSKKARQQHTVKVLSGTFIEGVFYKAGSVVEVSQDYYQRIKQERDGQIICL